MCFAGDILNALANVSGRKHPSTVQAKQLKMCLPLMPVVLHLVTSQVSSFLGKKVELRNVNSDKTLSFLSYIWLSGFNLCKLSSHRYFDLKL